VSSCIFRAPPRILSSFVTRLRVRPSPVTAKRAHQSLLRWQYLRGAATVAFLAHSRIFSAYSCVRGSLVASPPSCSDSPAVRPGSVNILTESTATVAADVAWTRCSVSVGRFRPGMKSYPLLVKVPGNNKNLGNSYLIHFNSEKCKWYTKMFRKT
jgi:hypothetical protein